MKSSTFWDRWLSLMGWLLVVFGLILGFFNQTQLFYFVFNRHVSSVLWPNGISPNNIVPFQAWIYGVLGFTVSGWGVFVLFLARHPFKKRERWARDCLFVGITLWYTTDTALSLHYGVNFNAVFNTALAVLFYLPLGITWNDFKKTA